jgi:predicted outer membrane repeat protein
VDVNHSCHAQISRCFFANNYARGGGGGVNVTGLADFEDDVFVSNRTSATGGGINVWVDGTANVSGCTFYDNRAGHWAWGGGIGCRDGGMVDVTNSLLAFNAYGRGIGCYSNCGQMHVECTNIFGNEGGNWVGFCIVEQEGINGNFSADPLFCDPESGDFRIQSDSPCALTRCDRLRARGRAAGGMWPRGR